jgi:hypothetical protein
MSVFMSSGPTPLGAFGRGVGAGIAGTAVMTAWQELSAKLQEPEESPGKEEEQPQDPWEQASAPAKVARRMIEGVFQRDVPAEWIPALTHGTHWGYGTAWGAAFGLIQGTRRENPVRAGVAFGTAVWAMSYVQLVPMGLYQPPWKYPPKQLAMDLSYHLAYGAGLGAAYAALDRA